MQQLLAMSLPFASIGTQMKARRLGCERETFQLHPYLQKSDGTALQTCWSGVLHLPPESIKYFLFILKVHHSLGDVQPRNAGSWWGPQYTSFTREHCIEKKCLGFAAGIGHWFSPSNIAFLIVQVAKAIGVALDEMQRNRTNIGEAAEIWFTLLEHDAIKKYPRAKKAVTERSSVVLDSGMNTLVKGDCNILFPSGAFLAANLLDPRFLGKKLSMQQRRDAVQWMQSQFQLRYPANKDELGACLTVFLSDGLPTPFFGGSTPSQWWAACTAQGYFTKPEWFPLLFPENTLHTTVCGIGMQVDGKCCHISRYVKFSSCTLHVPLLCRVGEAV